MEVVVCLTGSGRGGRHARPEIFGLPMVFFTV